jgi:transposase
VGEKSRTDLNGKAEKGWDHDPPPPRKWTPLGILMITTGALGLYFAAKETSDVWVDGLMQWWLQVGPTLSRTTRLVIYLDNGPHNSGRRRQFLKRVIEFADWSGLEIRLVYYPPYHSKYNPIERCWSAVEKKWGGSLLNSLAVILYWASRMTWKGNPPTVQRLTGEYADGIALTDKQWKPYAARLERSASLPRHDIVIRPKTCEKPEN